MDERNPRGLYIYLLEHQIGGNYYKTCAVFSTAETAMHEIMQETWYKDTEFNWTPVDLADNPILSWVAKTKDGNWRVTQLRVDNQLIERKLRRQPDD